VEVADSVVLVSLLFQLSASATRIHINRRPWQTFYNGG
jgi:hypothetical protein